MDNDKFPSTPPEDENSLSFVSQQNVPRRTQQKRAAAQRAGRKDKDDEDSGSNDEELSEDQGRSRGKKNTQFGIQNKQIQKKITPKVSEGKFKKPPGTSSPITTFLYKPGVLLPCLSPYLNCMIEIRIAREYISKKNPALVNRQVWGVNGVYSSHSDIVAMSIHHGLLSLSDIKLTADLYEGVSITCKVVKGKKSLNGSFKAPILSRNLKQQCPHCLKPEKSQWLTNLGSPDQLVQWARRMAVPENKRLSKQSYMQLMSYDQVPQQPATIQEQLLNKLLPPLNEGWITWDMCNEPSQKYNVITFMDRQTSLGYKTNTSFKLRSHVLFIENRTKKYEISMSESMREEDVFLEQNIFQIAEVNDPLKVDLEYMKAVGLPLPVSIKKELLKDLKWSEFIWSPSSLTVKDLTINGLICFKLIPLKMYEKGH